MIVAAVGLVFLAGLGAGRFVTRKASP